MYVVITFMQKLSLIKSEVYLQQVSLVMRMVRELFRETLYARYGVYIQRIVCKIYLKLKAQIKTDFSIIAERQYCNRFFFVSL